MYLVDKEYDYVNCGIKPALVYEYTLEFVKFIVLNANVHVLLRFDLSEPQKLSQKPYAHCTHKAHD